MVCCWHHLSTVTGTARLSVDSFHAMDLKLHLSCSQWAIIKMCSNRSVALRSNSPTMKKPEIFPTEESIQSTVSTMAQKWKFWCLKFREDSSTTVKRWAYLALHRVILSQAQGADAVNFCHFRLCTSGCCKVIFLSGHSLLFPQPA